jgi:hypothetical protein
MPAVIFFARLDLGKKSSFMVGHDAETVEKGLDRDQFVLILLHYDSLAFL